MPTPILEIPIGPQFEAFLKKFADYQQAVKEQPAVWAEAGDAIAATGAGFAVMTEALLEQNALFKKQEDAAKAVAKVESDTAKAKKKADKEQEDRDKQAAARRKAAVDETKKIAKNVADATVDLAKWVALGGLAGVVTGAASLWGLDQIVGSIAQQRTASQGLGVTMGEKQALNAQMSRYFNVDSALENIVSAQNDPSKRLVFSTLGVNPMGKDPAQLMGEMAVRARKLFLADNQNTMLARSQGLTSIFSEDELRTLARQRPGDIERSYGRAQTDWSPGGKLFLADDVGRKWQDFMAGMGEATTAIQDKFVSKLSTLEPDLTRIIGKFEELAERVLDRIDWKKLGDGLDKFTNYITSPQFQADFKVFIDDVSAVAGKLVDALTLLHLIPDHPTAVSRGADAAKELADEQRKWDSFNAVNIAQFGVNGPMVTNAEFGPRPTVASLAASDPVFAANLAAARTAAGVTPGGTWSAGGNAAGSAAGRAEFAHSAIGSPYVNAQSFFDRLVGAHVRIIEGRARGGHARNSEHYTGDAWDFSVPGMTNDQVIAKIRQSGVAFDELFNEQNHVHMGFRGQRGKLGTGFGTHVAITGHQQFGDGQYLAAVPRTAPIPAFTIKVQNQTGASVATSVNGLAQ
jgi:hypothetical protein